MTADAFHAIAELGRREIIAVLIDRERAFGPGNGPEISVTTLEYYELKKEI